MPANKFSSPEKYGRKSNSASSNLRIQNCQGEIEMLGKLYTKALVCSLILLLALALAPFAAAGGFYLAVERPAKSDAELKDVVLLVRPFGCHQPEDANVMVMAEGIANGKRQSINVQLIRTAKGVFAVKQQWPNSGAWVLNISGQYLGATRSVLVELGAQGKLPGSDDGKIASRMEQRKFTATEIDNALQGLSGKLARR
jgi:hypothetical protein